MTTDEVVFRIPKRKNGEIVDTVRPAQTGQYRSFSPSVSYRRHWQWRALFTLIQSPEPLLGRMALAWNGRPPGVSTWISRMKPNTTQDAGSFDPQVFLDIAGVAGEIIDYRSGESIFSQGDAAETVMYMQKGAVKFSVVNGSGREAVVAIFGPKDFFGEGCMAGQPRRMGTTTAITHTTVVEIQKQELMRALHEEHELCDRFIAYMIAHKIRVEADLIDQLFTSTEKRLASALLLLARYGKQEQPDRILAKISQETLAGMVGTTSSRVDFFMNKFRELGFIEYNGKIKVNRSLLSVVLQE
jgi:CRP/FNR family cyclic AMP-dependent transcriptional regulator